MPETLTGQCLCGAVTLSITGEPKFALTCYCSDCSRVTGTGHAVQVAFDKDAVSISGPMKTYERPADSGNMLGFGFCSDCGSPITKLTERAPGLTFLYAGALDDPGVVPEPKTYFEESRQPWDT